MKAMHLTFRLAVCVVALHSFPLTHSRSEDLTGPVWDFLESRCLDCHDDSTAKGDLDLAALEFDPASEANRKRWIKVHDKVEKGEMPPKKKAQPEPEERAAFLDALAHPLTGADLAHRLAEGGRVPARRLNRTEYEFTLRDLFELPHLEIKDSLPPDATAHGFDNQAEALALSRINIRAYLDAAEAEDAARLTRTLGPGDRAKLDQYLTSVREAEVQLQQAESWVTVPKPKVNMKPPEEITDQREFIQRTDIMLRLIRLAFETDSTRLITLHLDNFVGNPTVNLPCVSDGHHSLTHNSAKWDELKIIEKEQTKLFGSFLTALKSTGEGAETLLDRTMVFYGSQMSNAGRHDNTNLPALLAGGGLKHGQHLIFDAQNNHPLATLYVSMLQRLGVETDRFGSGTTTMQGLEMV